MQSATPSDGRATWMFMTVEACELCENDGGVVLFRNQSLRIVRVEDTQHPSYLRVVVNSHVREMTDLPKAVQFQVFEAVLACERVLRQVASAHKINLASLGNLTPHVHWHIVARYPTDPHFPDSIWANAKRRDVVNPVRSSDEALTSALLAELQASEALR